jgi:hypothetical protein
MLNLYFIHVPISAESLIYESRLTTVFSISDQANRYKLIHSSLYLIFSAHAVYWLKMLQFASKFQETGIKGNFNSETTSTLKQQIIKLSYRQKDIHAYTHYEH